MTFLSKIHAHYSTAETVWEGPIGHFSKTEPSKWHMRYSVDDPDAFIKHMKDYHSILSFASLSREQYEQLCKKFGIDAQPDETLENYGTKYGNFGMAHYHTDPKNRKNGLAGTLHQKRYYALKKEGAKPKPKNQPTDTDRDGQLWEPCKKCGREPVYMPSHLCDKCQNKQ